MRFVSLMVVFVALVLTGCEQPPLPPAIQAQHDVRDAAQALQVLKASGTFIFDPETQACWLYYYVSYGGSFTQVSCAAARRRMVPYMLEMLESIEKVLGNEIP